MSNTFEFIVGVVNICLLLYLLWFILIKPLKKTVAEREAKVKNMVDEAEAIYNDAKKLRDKYQALVDNLENEKKELIERANCDAKELLETTASSARTEAKEVVAKVTCEMEDARRITKAELRAEIAKATVAQAKALLVEHIDEEVHQSVLEKFLAKIGG